MESEDAFSNLHYVIAIVFGLAVAVGSFSGTWAMTSMNNSQMSEVTGQEGIEMDLHIGGNFAINEVNYIDDDGHTNGAQTQGIVGMHNIQSTAQSSASVAFEGITLDAEGSIMINHNSTQGIVIGVPDVSDGLVVRDIAAEDDTVSTSGWSPSKATDSGANSMGGVAIGGVNTGGTRLEISGN